MNGKTLTAEQCSKLSLYILMTTNKSTVSLQYAQT